MIFFNTADENWQKVYNDDELRGVLCTGWGKWLEELGRKLRIGDGSNKTFHSIMATWEDDEIDGSKVASKMKSRDSSEEDSGNETDGGYNTDRCGQTGGGTWRELKIKQQGGRTGRKLLDEMSDDGVGKDDGIERERERGNAQKEQKEQNN
jgi:hypothetical protein